MDDFEELAERVRILTEAFNQLKDLAQNEVQSREVQSTLNHLFNENIMVFYDALYGRNNLSAMALEGEI